jgi:hypothetical protein
MGVAIDKKARRILFKTYWSSSGWKVPRDEPDAADLAYAKAAGVMFDPERLTHRSAMERLLAARRLADESTAAEAFAASLTSREVHLRPALASACAIQTVEMHGFVGGVVCSRCGQLRSWEHDFSSTNFARLKWGSIPRAFMVDHAFILERFSEEPQPRATAEDRRLLGAMLSVADSLPQNARARDLEKAWQPLLPSNREERDLMIEILLACGVLKPSRQSAADRRRIPLRSNWTDDAALWRGDDGIERTRAAELFGCQGE